MATKTSIVDLDAKIGPGKTKRDTITVKLFGREWDIYTDLNVYATLRIDGGDPKDLIAFLDAMVSVKQLDDWRSTLASQPDLDGERLGKVIGALVEAIAERPTKQPSGSGRGAPSRTSPLKSVGGSSSRAATRTR